MDALGVFTVFDEAPIAALGTAKADWSLLMVAISPSVGVFGILYQGLDDADMLWLDTDKACDPERHEPTSQG